MALPRPGDMAAFLRLRWRRRAGGGPRRRAPLHQLARRNRRAAPPGSAAERLCPLLARFFSSAIFPLQSIAGNRMWVTQQHCFRLRKPPLLPKGSRGARGCRRGCWMELGRSRGRSGRGARARFWPCP